MDSLLKGHRENQFPLNTAGFQHFVSSPDCVHGEFANIPDAHWPEPLGFIKEC